MSLAFLFFEEVDRFMLTIQLILYIRTQRNKETKMFFRYKDNKRLKSRHKGLQWENFVDFVSSLLLIVSSVSEKCFVSSCLCV